MFGGLVIFPTNSVSTCNIWTSRGLAFVSNYFLQQYPLAINGVIAPTMLLHIAIQVAVSSANGHIMLNAPVLVRSLKLSSIEPSQYLDG